MPSPRNLELCVFLLALIPMVRAETKQDTVSVSSTTSNDVGDKLKTRFMEVCQDNKFMGTVSITVNGTAVFSAACGWADAPMER